MGEGDEESGRGKNVISPLVSLLNRLQPVCGVLWPNFTEPEYLLAKCSPPAKEHHFRCLIDNSPQIKKVMQNCTSIKERK